MSIEFEGPLQKPLRDIVPYLKQKLCAHLLKNVDIAVIGRVDGEPPLVDMFGTIHIDELIVMLRAIATNLEERKKKDKWHIGNDWSTKS